MGQQGRSEALFISRPVAIGPQQTQQVPAPVPLPWRGPLTGAQVTSLPTRPCQVAVTVVPICYRHFPCPGTILQPRQSFIYIKPRILQCSAL